VRERNVSMWMCVRGETAAIGTLLPTREESIAALIGTQTWAEYEKAGWRCEPTVLNPSGPAPTNAVPLVVIGRRK
jgi:hypothetical protein